MNLKELKVCEKCKKFKRLNLALTIYMKCDKDVSLPWRDYLLKTPPEQCNLNWEHQFALRNLKSDITNWNKPIIQIKQGYRTVAQRYNICKKCMKILMKDCKSDLADVIKDRINVHLAKDEPNWINMLEKVFDERYPGIFLAYDKVCHKCPYVSEHRLLKKSKALENKKKT